MLFTILPSLLPDPSRFSWSRSGVTLAVFVAILLAGSPVAAQTIWLEDFSGANQGWTQNFTDCDGTAASFAGVNNSRFETTDMEGAPCCPSGGGNDNQWLTNPINIAGNCNVSISVNYGFIGTFECVAGGPYFGCSGNVAIDNGHDQILFQYRIDGGAWVQFGYVCGGQAGTATATGLTGTTIEIRIMPANKATAETYWFDNVLVQGTTPPVMTQPADITVCAQQPVSVAFSGPAGATYNWTNSNTAIGLGAAGTGNINFTAANVLTTQTATITVTPTVGTCPGTPTTFTITVEPRPTVTSPGNQTVCPNDPVSVFFGGTATSYTWTNTNTGIGLGASGTGDISFTAANVATTQTGTISVTPLGANGCPGTPINFTITVQAPPTVNAPANVTVCAGQAVNVPFTGTAGATFNWLNDNTAIGLGAMGTGPVSFTAANVTATETATITVIPTQGACAGAAQMFTITVNPTPTANPVNPQTVCAGDAVSVALTGTAATFNWTNTNPAIGLGASGTGNISFTAAGVATTQTGTVTVTPTSAGCAGPTQSFPITVHPVPVVNDPPDQVICSGQPLTVTFGGTAGATFTYAIATPVAGLPLGGTGSFSLGSTPSVASTTVATYTVTPNIGSCVGTPQTFTITLEPVATVTPPASQTVCSGQPVSVAFSGTAPAYNWTNSNPAIGLPASGSGPISFTSANVASTQTGTITVTPGGPCPGPAQSFTITVNPTPTVTAPANQSACSGQAVNVGFTGSPGSTFAWTNDNPAIGLAASGTGAISFTAASVATTQTATITVTPTSGAGTCPGTPQTFTITVNPGPTMSPVNDETACAGDPVAVLFSGDPGTTFNWTNSNPAIGLPAAGTGNLNFSAANVATTQTGTITVTPVNGPCAGATETFTITVSPVPTVAQPANQTVCAGQAVNVGFTGTAGATFSWTNSNAAIGLPTSGTGNISFTAAGVAAAQTATITVTPASGPCAGTPRTFTITVNPSATMAAPANQTVCGGQPVSVAFSGTAGATFNWTNSNPAIGLPASGSGNISFTSASVGAPQTATITVTPAVGTCPGTAQTFTITVNPVPTVNAPANVSVCTGDPVSVNFTGTAGATFAWTNSNPAIGLPASGAGPIGFTTANVATAQTATITVTPTFGSGPGACTGTPQSFTITVSPGVSVTNPGNQAACVGDAVTINFTGTGNPAFSWTNSNPAIGLAATGTGNIGFTAANVASATTATITVTPSGAGCAGAAQTFTITVSPTPTATAPANQTACAGAAMTIPLTGSAGATFNWTNSNPAIGLPASGSGNLNFTAANVGATETATITITPVVGSCSGAPQTFVITVNPGPAMTAPANQTACAGQNVTVAFSGAAGSTFNWTNSNPAIGLAAAGTGNLNFTAAAGSTTETATITVTPVNAGCTGAAQTFTITVNPTPFVIDPTDVSACTGEVVMVPFTGLGGATFGWTNSDPSIGLPASGSGDLNFTTANVAVSTTAVVTVTPAIGTCTGPSQTLSITVSPGVSVANPGNQTVCAGDAVAVSFTGSGNPSFTWTNDNPAIGLAASGTGNIAFTATGTGTASVTVTPGGGGCQGTAQTFTITVANAPVATAPSNQTVCGGEQVAVGLGGSPGATFNWTNSNPAIGLPAAGSGPISFTAGAVATTQTATVTVTPVLGTCSGAPVSFDITVNPAATAAIAGNTALCNGESTTLTASGGQTYLWNAGDTTATITVSPTATTTYYLTVTGGAGCVDIDSVTVTVAPQLVAAVAGNTTICKGDSTVLTASGGAQFGWNTGAATASITVAPIVTTSYSVIVGNGGTCADTAAVTVTVHGTATLMIDGHSCNPADTGTIVLVLSTVNGCDSTIITTVGLLQSDSVAVTDFTCNPNQTGTFAQTLTNQYGCDSVVVTTVLFDAAAIDTTVLSATTCDPAQAGTVQTLLTNSAGCDSLVIQSTTLLPTDSVQLAETTCNPALAGTFVQLLQNQYGCDSTVVRVVTFDPAAIDTTQLAATTCDPAQAGVAQTLLSGADGCDSLVITTTALLPADSVQLAETTCNPALAGTFVQTLQNQYGCDSTVVRVVTFDPAAIDTTQLAATTCDPSLAGVAQTLLSGADGCDSLVITTTALLPTDSVQLTETTCNPALAGTFVQTLQNQYGCDSTVVRVVTFDPAAVDTTQLAATTCDPAQAGTFQTLLSGADGCDSLVITTRTLLPADTTVQQAVTCDPAQAGTTQILLANAAGCDSLVITNTVLLFPDTTVVLQTTCDPTQAGTSILVLSNVDGCDSTILTTVVFDPANCAPALTLTATAPSCAGGSSGSLSLSVTNAVPPLGYAWTGPGGTTGTGQITALTPPTVIQNLPAGIYTVTVTNAAGLTTTAVNTIAGAVPLQVTALAAAQYNGYAVSCNGAADATVNGAAAGGTAPFTFSWSTGATSAALTGIGAGTYSVTATDANGCSNSAVVTVSEPAPLSLAVAVGPADCREPLVDVSVTGTGGAGGFQVTVDGNVTPGATSSLEPGLHVVGVQDANGCSVDSTITVDPAPALLVSLPADTTVQWGQPLRIEALTNGLAYDTMVWSPLPDTACAGCPVQEWTPLESARITVTIRDSSGCTASDAMLVLVDRKLDVYVPNVFTPDGDGVHDLFQIFAGPSVVALEDVRVYDRWGDLQYAWDEPVDVAAWPGWDGRTRGKVVNPGVYVYWLRVRRLDGEVVLLKGDVTVLFN